MIPDLSVEQKLVYRRLLELVRKHAALDARVAVKKNTKGEVVMAIVVPTVPAATPDARLPRARRRR